MVQISALATGTSSASPRMATAPASLPRMPPESASPLKNLSQSQAVVFVGPAPGLLHRVLAGVVGELALHGVQEADARLVGEEHRVHRHVGQLLADAAAVLGR